MKALTNINLIIFDMDGLMFDTEKISYDAWVKAADLFKYHIDWTLFEKTIGANLNDTKAIYLNHFGEQLPFDAIMKERVKISNETIEADGVPIKKGLVELLQTIKHKKIRMAVATSTSRARAIKLLKLSQVDAFFDAILCGDEVKQSKPNPEIFLKVAEKLNCQPENCLVLEDSELGIIAAAHAGMHPIMIPDMKMPSPAIEKLLYRKMDNLLDVKDFIETFYI